MIGIPMNINGLRQYPRSVQRFDLAKRGNSAAYSRMLSDVRQTGQTLAIHLYLPTENTLYSGGTGLQTVYAEYTADSTAEDPIVRIRGRSSGGEYDFTCRISDIDPEQASYAEMCALWGHLRKTGELSFQFGGEDRPVVPYGVEVRDVTQRQNYMSMINRMTTSNQFDQANQISAKELLDIYQKFTGTNAISGKAVAEK